MNNFFNETLFSCTINSNRQHLADELIRSTPDINFDLFTPNNPKSYSEMMNQSILSSKSEYCIFLSDKARPESSKSFYKIIQLLRSGYGLVGLYALGFFGIHKETIRRVGFFDERFVGGGQEDMDFLFRLNEANIAYYYDLEIPFLNIPSSWPPSDNNRKLLADKWAIVPNLCSWPQEECRNQVRKLAETRPYNKEFGELVGTNFLDKTFTIHHK
jgi:hypothetical protein